MCDAYGGSDSYTEMEEERDLDGFTLRLGPAPLQPRERGRGQPHPLPVPRRHRDDPGVHLRVASLVDSGDPRDPPGGRILATVTVLVGGHRRGVGRGGRRVRAHRAGRGRVRAGSPTSRPRSDLRPSSSAGRRRPAGREAVGPFTSVPVRIRPTVDTNPSGRRSVFRSASGVPHDRDRRPARRHRHSARRGAPGGGGDLRASAVQRLPGGRIADRSRLPVSREDAPTDHDPALRTRGERGAAGDARTPRPASARCRGRDDPHGDPGSRRRPRRRRGATWRGHGESTDRQRDRRDARRLPHLERIPPLRLHRRRDADPNDSDE